MTAPPNGAPPKRPRLVLRVGVTGHRPNKLPDSPALRTRVREVLTNLAHLIDGERSAGYSDERPVLRVVSALAEGTDRLVPEVALTEVAFEPKLEVDVELQVALPYAAAKHEEEFSKPASPPGSFQEFKRFLGRATAVLVLDGEKESPDAYQAVGASVRRNCDVLLAVWDGKPEKGKGGTAEMVREAVTEAHIPTIRIDSCPPHAVTSLTDSEHPEQARPELAPVLERLRKLLEPPPIRFGSRGRKLADLREDYFAERVKPGSPGLAYKLVINLVRLDQVWRDLRSRSRVSEPPHPVPAEIARQLDAQLDEPYARADTLANYYGGRDRGAFTLAYALAPVAVFGALVDYFLRPDLLEASAWAGVELVALLSLFGLYWYGGVVRHWHERWLDYRSVAERLRHLKFLWPLDRARQPPPVPAYHRGGRDPRETWVEWYVRAVSRAAGIFNGVVDDALIAACRTQLMDQVFHGPEGQISYHTQVAARMHSVHRRLEVLAMVFFGTAVVACVLHFVLSGHAWWPVKRGITLLAALLPALGASAHGFLSQGDFQNIAHRSEAMRAELEDLAPQVEHPAAANLTPTAQWAALGSVAEKAAEVMSAELVDWRGGIEDKTLRLV